MPNPRNHTIKKYGWVPDLPDHRDFLYSAPQAVLGPKLPKSVDLRPHCPPIYDQGQLGSCTGNAIAGAFQFEQMKQKIANWVPSRLFIYYNERVIEGTVSSDSGAQIRDGAKSVATTGVCPETDWPYDITKFAVKPPDPPCYADAAKNTATSYQRVPQILNQMKGCLASGYPFVMASRSMRALKASRLRRPATFPCRTRAKSRSAVMPSSRWDTTTLITGSLSGIPGVPGGEWQATSRFLTPI